MYAELRGRPCNGYNSDIRVQVSKTKYVYPDFTVVCGESEFSEEQPNNLLNPTMVVEVISESSAYRGRFVKLDLYGRIPSIKIYLIVEQDQAGVTLLTRQADGWFLRLYSGLDAVVPLDDIQAQLKLSELYETVEFPQGDRDTDDI